MTLLGGMGTFYGPAVGRAGPHLAQPADRLLHRVLAADPRAPSWSSSCSSFPGGLAGAVDRALAPPRRGGPPVLEVRGLSQELRRLHGGGRGVASRCRAGSISAIIGPNGAGKTTLFNLITGHLEPDDGRVVFKERDVTGIAPHDLCRLGMGRSFQRTNIFPRLTVYENIQAAYVSHRGRGFNLFTPVERLYRPETESLLRGGGPPGEGGRDVGFPLPRQPEAARARHHPRARARDPAARRAHRRDVRHRDPRVDPAHRAHRGRPRASPCSSPSTTWRSSSPSPTASRCCTRAG